MFGGTGVDLVSGTEIGMVGGTEVDLVSGTEIGMVGGIGVERDVTRWAVVSVRLVWITLGV